jgi:glucose-6-phosphate-specific signal transduction histidine kinase
MSSGSRGEVRSSAGAIAAVIAAIFLAEPPANAASVPAIAMAVVEAIPAMMTRNFWNIRTWEKLECGTLLQQYQTSLKIFSAKRLERMHVEMRSRLPVFLGGHI